MTDRGHSPGRLHMGMKQKPLKNAQCHCINGRYGTELLVILLERSFGTLANLRILIREGRLTAGPNTQLFLPI